MVLVRVVSGIVRAKPAVDAAAGLNAAQGSGEGLLYGADAGGGGDGAASSVCSHAWVVAPSGADGSCLPEWTIDPAWFRREAEQLRFGSVRARAS